MPPIQMFRERQRPKGLEFPACKACNHGTSHADLVASLMGRLYPDAKTERAKEEVKKILKSVANNIPGLLQEMEIRRAGQKLARRTIPNLPTDGGVMRADGPIMTRHMRTFGAKLGFALHYEAHRTPVPIEGGVQAIYFTNVNVARGEIPHRLIELMPEPRTLSQGTRNVSEQFKYSWLLTEERRHTAFYAEFNEAFAIAAVTSVDRTEFLTENAKKHPVIVPGDFKNSR